MEVDSFLVELQEEDEEMKQNGVVKHASYVPHLWRSVPEYLWGLVGHLSPEVGSKWHTTEETNVAWIEQ